MLRRCSYSIDVIENIVTIHGSRIARCADTGKQEGIKDRVSALWICCGMNCSMTREKIQVPCYHFKSPYGFFDCHNLEECTS